MEGALGVMVMTIENPRRGADASLGSRVRGETHHAAAAADL
jgi:hypothetical protein